MISLRSVALALLVAGCTVPVAAPMDDHHAEGHGAGTQGIGAFVGGSSEVGDSDGLALGLDYTYRIGDRWGFGAFAEAVTGLDRSFATGLQAFVNPVGDLILVAGPGMERHHSEWAAIGRVGALYEFPIEGGWTLAPSIFYDFSERSDLLIYGVTTGIVW